MRRVAFPELDEVEDFRFEVEVGEAGDLSLSCFPNGTGLRWDGVQAGQTVIVELCMRQTSGISAPTPMMVVRRRRAPCSTAALPWMTGTTASMP